MVKCFVDVVVVSELLSQASPPHQGRSKFQEALVVPSLAICALNLIPRCRERADDAWAFAEEDQFSDWERQTESCVGARRVFY